MKSDWKDLYPDAEEPISSNAPEAWVNISHLHLFVYADHARDKAIGISNFLRNQIWRLKEDII